MNSSSSASSFGSVSPARSTSPASSQLTLSSGSSSEEGNHEVTRAEKTKGKKRSSPGAQQGCGAVGVQEEPTAGATGDSKRQKQPKHEQEVEVPEDGYHWRKYGQKPLMDSPNIIRAYYACGRKRAAERCPVKKQVDRKVGRHAYVKVTYNGVQHSHPPPSKSAREVIIFRAVGSSDQALSSFCASSLSHMEGSPMASDPSIYSAGPGLATKDPEEGAVVPLPHVVMSSSGRLGPAPGSVAAGLEAGLGSLSRGFRIATEPGAVGYGSRQTPLRSCSAPPDGQICVPQNAASGMGDAKQRSGFVPRRDSLPKPAPAPCERQALSAGGGGAGWTGEGGTRPGIAQEGQPSALEKRLQRILQGQVHRKARSKPSGGGRFGPAKGGQGAPSLGPAIGDTLPPFVRPGGIWRLPDVGTQGGGQGVKEEAWQQGDGGACLAEAKTAPLQEHEMVVGTTQASDEAEGSVTDLADHLFGSSAQPFSDDVFPYLEAAAQDTAGQIEPPGTDSPLAELLDRLLDSTCTQWQASRAMSSQSMSSPALSTQVVASQACPASAAPEQALTSQDPFLEFGFPPF